jgi:hypothetical protein
MDTLGAATAALVAPVVDGLRRVPGVVAVGLGGSYASGTALPDSDVDLGLYYRAAAPIEVEAVRRLAAAVNDTPDPTVSDRYGWGRWVNGGAWLTVGGQRIDPLYRNLDQLARVVADSAAGEWESDYYQQYTHGFHSYVYLGELRICRPLWDPDGVLVALRARVAVYPPALKRAVIRRWLGGQRMWWPVLHKLAGRGDAYNVAGGVNRMAAALTQVLFALNDVYFVADKGALERIEGFPLRPDGYSDTVRRLLGHPETTPAELASTVQQLESLFQQVAGLCAPWIGDPETG